MQTRIATQSPNLGNFRVFSSRLKNKKGELGPDATERLRAAKRHWRGEMQKTFHWKWLIGKKMLLFPFSLGKAPLRAFYIQENVFL